MNVQAIRHSYLLAVSVAFAVLASSAQAIQVGWNIDSSQSSIRLNFPDSNITYQGVSINARIRDQGSNTVWTDANGRQAKLSGTIMTDVVPGGFGGFDFSSLVFSQAGSTITALDDKNLRPNPAVWDPISESYTDSSTGLAALGGKLRGSALAGQAQFDAMLFSMSDLSFGLSGGGAVNGGVFTGATAFGISDGVLAVDGQNNMILGQSLNLPDLYEPAPSSIGGANSGAITIGPSPYPYLWQMTYLISIPIAIEFDVDGVVNSIPGTATGQIVALTFVPEPSSIAMAGCGMLGLVAMASRRRRDLSDRP